MYKRQGITVSHISKRLLTDPGSLSPLLKRLEADGLLTRKRRVVDERVVELHLTDKGRRLRDQAQTVPGCIINASGQSMPDLAELKRQLLKLRENLKTLT